MRNLIIYLFPLALDIVISLALFVSRHSFAERGMSVGLVGRISIIYGVVYIIASGAMGRIVKPAYARVQMLGACGTVIVLMCVLAHLERPAFILAVFAIFPFAANLFFNAFQAYMLDVDSGAKKPLSKIVGHYTFAWSFGFALGPFVSATVKQSLSWSAAYYAAAIITLGVAVAVLLFKPAKDGRTAGDSVPIVNAPANAVAAPLSGWMGVFLVFSTWMCIATYWPVQAEMLGFSTETKGWVEFGFAMCQALGALLICQFTGWYHRSMLLPLVMLPAAFGAAAFGISSGAAVFLVGACAIGFTSGCAFTYAVYHCMFDKALAVRRVAKNELTVGVCFIMGPVLAWVLGGEPGTFSSSYMKLSGFVLIGLAIQYSIAVMESRRASAVMAGED